MGDNIGIDWGMAPGAPTQNPANAFMQGFQNGRTMGLERTADQSLADALHNPTDMNALTKLAVYNPEAAKAMFGAMDYQRAAQARQAAAGVISAYGPAGAQMPAQAPQQAAPGQMPPVAPGASFEQAMAPVGAPGTPPAMPHENGGMLDPNAPHTQQLGAMAAQGQPVDPSQAWARLYALDPAMGDNMLKAVQGMDKVRMDRLSDGTNAMAAAAQTLLGIPQSQRAQVLTQMAPQLMQHGITQAQIEQAIQAGVPDTLLQGIVGQGLGIKGLVEQANKDRDFTLDVRKTDIQGASVADTARYHAWEMNKPVQVAAGAALVGPDGKVVYDPLGGGAGGAQLNPEIISYAKSKGLNDAQASALAAVSAGEGGQIDNNNGLGGGHGAYGLFQIRDSGGQQEMLRQYGPKPTLEQQVDFYLANNAKASANFWNAKDPQAALRALVSDVQKAGPDSQALFERAQASLNGGNGGGGAIEGQAKAIAEGRQPPLTGRAAATGVGARIMQRAYQINPDLDSKIYSGEKKALDNFMGGKNADLVRTMSVSMDHLNTLGAAAKALGNGNVTVFNRLGNAFAAATGSEAPTNFDATKAIVATEVAKAISGAQISDSRVNDVQAGISHASSPAQLTGYIAQVQALIGGQLHGLQRQYEQTTGKKDFDRFLSDPAKRVVGSIGSSRHPPDITAIMAKYGAR